MTVQFPEFIDKVVLVTGAGSGMGRATAISFAEQGANVIVNDVDHDAVGAVAWKIREMGRKSLAVKCDVSNSREVSEMFNQVVKEFGTLHILVNNAGVSGAIALLEETLEEEFDRTMEINLKGVFLCSKAVVPIMKKNNYGKIVNVASTVAKRIGSASGGDYAASKAAVLSLTRTFAYELAPYGINVNATCPGRTLTTMAVETPEHKERLKKIPIGRYATPQDQANVIILLCSDRASYLVGQHIDVDGGILLGWTDFESHKEAHQRKK
jgi:NAD(P)-dependent dehydrogenase (short-subunit alcohol dehydrogenase family)